LQHKEQHYTPLLNISVKIVADKHWFLYHQMAFTRQGSPETLVSWRIRNNHRQCGNLL